MNYSNCLTSGRISKIGLFDFRGIHVNLYSARGGGGGAILIKVFRGSSVLVLYPKPENVAKRKSTDRFLDCR